MCSYLYNFIFKFTEYNETHLHPTGLPGDDECYVSSTTSITIFLVAIMASRFGLWIADLSVTQILQARLLLLF